MSNIDNNNSTSEILGSGSVYTGTGILTII